MRQDAVRRAAAGADPLFGRTVRVCDGQGAMPGDPVRRVAAGDKCADRYSPVAQFEGVRADSSITATPPRKCGETALVEVARSKHTSEVRGSAELESLSWQRKSTFASRGKLSP
jgi:hypothetical protein